MSVVPCLSSADSKIPFLGDVGTEEFLMKLTSQITEMVSAKFSQGEGGRVTDCSISPTDI